MVEIISRLTIDLHKPSRHGTAQIVFRCAPKDRENVKRAAHRVGLPLSEFMRIVMIQAAEQLLASAKPTMYETYDNFAQTIAEPDDVAVKISPLLPPGAKS